MFDWKKESEEFDREFNKIGKRINRVQNLAVVWFIFIRLLGLGFLGGMIFVVVKILLHFGIL